MNNWFVIRRGHVYTVEKPTSATGLRIGNASTRADCRTRAARMATEHAAKASGGHKGKWRVDKITEDQYIVRKVT